MSLEKLQKNTERLIVVLFILCIFLLAILFSQGVLWQTETSTSIIAALSVVMALLAAAAAIVSTYGFVFYFQEAHLRNLISAIMSATIVPLSLFYLVIHQSFPFLTPFPPVDYKTDVLAMIEGLTVGIGFLAVALSGRRFASKRQHRLVIILGAVMVPLASFLVALLPASFHPGWEPINNAGLIVGAILLGASAITIGIYGRDWRKRITSIPTGIILSLCTFCIGAILLILQTQPNQYIEVVSMFMILMAFVILALSMMATAVTEPHQGLATKIRIRTKELGQSRDESEFYLNIWSHEVGNILQGILMYLEGLEIGAYSSGDIEAKIEPAKALSERATRVIRQVSELAQMKEQAPKLYPVGVGEIIRNVVEVERAAAEVSSAQIQVNQVGRELIIQADGLLSKIFSNIIRNVLERSKNRQPSIHIMAFEVLSTVHVEIRDNADPLPDGVVSFLLGEGGASQSEVGLDLFILRNLIYRYSGKISIERLESSNENLMLLRFDSFMMK
ncbi:MAG: sensor histidine kinase [Candidatus Thorarchaeota archaeon]